MANLHYLCTAKSGCSAVGSALRSGRRGRAFESPHPDFHLKPPRNRRFFIWLVGFCSRASLQAIKTLPVVFLVQYVKHFFKCICLVDLLCPCISVVDMYKWFPKRLEWGQLNDVCLTVFIHYATSVTTTQRTACKVINKTSTAFFVRLHGTRTIRPPFQVYA